MEADATLVRPDGIVVLDAPATLHADIAVIVFPANAEADDAVGLGDAAQDLVFVILLLIGDEVEDVLGDFLHGLREFRLAWIALLYTLDERREIDMIRNCHWLSPAPKTLTVSP